MIERSFAWLSRNCRFAKGYVRLIACATAMTVLAFIRLLAKQTTST